MHIAFLNPQGNFDPKDSYWTAHPDFGGQLVYVKQLALAMGALGHTVDIVTRQIIDPQWPEFAAPTEAYPGNPNVRILRIPCGPQGFLAKEELWPHLVAEFVPRLLAHYHAEDRMPDALTAHYGDGGLCAALIGEQTGIPFTFTAHSLGAQKMDKMHVTRQNIAALDKKYHFARRIMAERLGMNRSVVNVTSTAQERYSQYTHPAYRGAVDPTDDAAFAVVPPGVAMEIFDRKASYANESAIYAHVAAMLARDLPPERRGLPCVVASSRLDPKKNHLGLVEAFAGSPALRASANLVFVTSNLADPLHDYSMAGTGERAVMDAIMARIDQAGMRGEVSMFALSGQGDLAAGYRYLATLRSVFSLTALYEPFGLAPLEAIAAGLPAVVTKFGGPSESLRDGDEEYGILVDPTNAAEVSAGLYALTSSPERWLKYAEAGYNRVQAQYTWARTAEGYLRALGNREQGTEDRGQDATQIGAASARVADDPRLASADEPARLMPSLTPETRPLIPSRLLPIHPYFQQATPENDITAEQFDDVYFKIDVLGVGETLVDFISHERANSLRAAKQFTRYLGGQPANVAVYVAKLGGRSAVLSKVGSGYFGDFLEEQLQAHGVSTEALLRTGEMPSTSAFITRTAGVPDFQVNRGADTLLAFGDVRDDLISRARAIHTSCFALSHEPERSAIRRAVRLAHKAGKVVSFDPNYSPRIWPDKSEAWEIIAQIMPSVTLAKPSAEDARRLFDYNLSEDKLEELALREFHDLGAQVVIFTRSGNTVTVSDGATVERVGPLPAVEVVDATGGRDAFLGALLVAHLDGKTWPQAVRFAHEVAAIKLRVVGHVERMIDRAAIYARIA